MEKKSKKGGIFSMIFDFKKLDKTKLKNPILIEGLPGIGNVGKVAVDFIIDNIRAKKSYDIYSDSFPHAVFVNENNLVELPTISIYTKRVNNRDLMFLAGDIQPIDESSCYEFCNKLMELLVKYKAKEIITMGGIGLQQIPNNPKVYCTANEKKIIKKYKSKNLSNNIYGVVGPIIGVTGLLVGLSADKKIPAIALLAETLGHPNFLGIKGAREILKILNTKLKLKLNLKKLDEEIVQIEKEIKTKTQQFSQIQKRKGGPKKGAMDYIG